MTKLSYLTDIIVELLRKEFRVRYKHLALGYIWSIASPLTYAALYYIVFKLIFAVKTPNYPLFLVAGLFPWQWISNSISVGAMTFYGNAPLIKKTLFPRYLISVVVVLQDMIHFVISLPIILCMILITDTPLTSSWFWLPALLALQLGLTYALNLLTATINLFFRDLERLVQLGMTFLFYMTPVLYSEEMIPERFQALVILHPLAPLIICWRHLFLGLPIDPQYLLSSAIWVGFLCITAQYTYKKLQWRFAEVL
ncbi:ABC transporter permease [Bdellovibrio bacteriovorus]|uniref:ABC transporter permease n=1 Tax=Bdellovibrio bacteriovorus TaxID=959 RepID=UPI0035A5A568